MHHLLRRIVGPLLGLPLVLEGQARVLRVDPAPVLAIASTAEDGSVRFATAAWATRLPTGEVAIADLGDASLRVVGADGRTVRTLGRRGNGPGEYQVPIWVGRCAGDSLAVWDMGAARLTILPPGAPAGASPSTRTIAAAAGGGLHVACAADGTLALATDLRPGRDLPAIARGETPQGGQYEITTMRGTIRLFDAAGNARAALPPRAFGEFVTGRLTSTGGFGGFPRPLGASTGMAFLGERLVVASADSGVVVGHAPDGREVFRFRVPAVSRPVSASDYRRAMGPAFALLPARAQESAMAFASVVPAPRMAPPFWRLLTDPAGLIWLVVSPEGASPTVMRIHTPDGAVVGAVSVPGTFTPFEVDAAHLLGRRENADGEQEVVVLRVRRAVRE